MIDIECKGGYACFTSTPVGIIQALVTSIVHQEHILTFESFHLTVLCAFHLHKILAVMETFFRTAVKRNLQFETPVHYVKHAEKHWLLIGALSNDDAPNLND